MSHLKVQLDDTNSGYEAANGNIVHPAARNICMS
jgi:hypothetical protein